jgi:hypothetical protein
MNPAYQTIIGATDDERRGLFLTAAARIGTTAQNIEKDFWVCWTLDALFHRLKSGGPRLLFKGGTSLSKAYGLISRFSEDIDVTVFREDIGEPASVEELERLTKKKRGVRLDAIRAACQTYIDTKLRVELDALAKEAMESASKNPATMRVVLDEEDKDRQSLLIHYPSVLEESGYVIPSVKIESGAKSALDPHSAKAITPYLGADLSDSNGLAIKNVMTIDPERTFLDKVLILHGMTFYFTEKGALRGNGRMSRHYYDVYRLMAVSTGAKACADISLIEDCVRHARMFFYRSNTGLDLAHRGSFRLTPTKPMHDALARDYDAMSTMIFGEVPSFETVLESIANVEERLNAG